MKQATLLVFTIMLLSCSPQTNSWQQIDVLDGSLCKENKTVYTTNHQGEHSLTDCFVFVDNDTLYIHFPAGLPAYWLGTEIKVVNGMFKAETNGIPFIPNIELVYQIKKQQLILNKPNYTIGDTLRGYVEIVFDEQDKTHNQSNEYYFKGCIYKIVRAKDYQPFEDNAAIMSYSLDIAINELGAPLNDYSFNTVELPEFRVELLNIFPPSDTIHIRELTWNTSDDAQISDAGIYRLTVWYAQKDGIWKPVHLFKWNTNMQF